MDLECVYRKKEDGIELIDFLHIREKDFQDAGIEDVHKKHQHHHNL